VDADRADAVLAALGEGSAQSVRRLALGLTIAGGPLSGLGRALDSHADALEFDDVSGQLANLAMRRAVRRAALYDGELVVQLEDAREGFWRAVREAIVDEREPRTAKLGRTA
jgi:hypothetical protein